MPLGATCLPTSKAITIVSGSTLPSATSLPIRQRLCPPNPVSTLPGEAQTGRNRNQAMRRLLQGELPGKLVGAYRAADLVDALTVEPLAVERDVPFLGRLK